MQPFLAADQVKDAYWRYITTSFPIRDAALRSRFAGLARDEKLLWQEPFVALARPFCSGGTFTALVAAGVFDPRTTAAAWGFDELHAHQAAAVRRLSTRGQTPANIVVASGTGSGKTESFLIPIVDDCLRNPEPRGVRAVILYPMNALANDQLDRLRPLLAGTGVTFGRYTGDTPFDEQDAQSQGAPRPESAPAEERYTRREIQQDPPQILLTNYVMLELLLLRKEDQKIFKGVQPRFLVLDEVHTYTGVLGAETACLIRRFKEHTGLQPGQLVCVGASATVMDDGADGAEAGRSLLTRFASELFAERFAADAVVAEEYEEVVLPATPLHAPRPIPAAMLAQVNPDDPAQVRALAQAALGLALPADDREVFPALYAATRELRAFAELERLLLSPRPLSALVQTYGQLPGRAGVAPAQIEAEVTALLLLGSAARRPNSGEPPETRFKPKLHVVVRSLAPLNVCLHCGRLLSDGVTTCACAQEEGATRFLASNLVAEPTAQALALGLCRSCGADFRLGSFAVTDAMLRTSKGKLRPRKDLDISHVGAVALLPSAGDNHSDGDQATLLLYPGALDDLAQGDGDDEPAVRGVEYGVCPSCLQAQPGGAHAVCENPACSWHGQGPLPRFVAFLGGARCPVCQAQGKGRRPQIITPLRSGAAPSVAVLAQSLFPTLADHAERKRSEKRILIFADSRQDTAHQAGFLRDRHQVFTQRQIVYRTIAQQEATGAGPIPLPELARTVFLRTKDARGDVEAMNLLTPIEYRTADAAGFFEEGQTISKAQMEKAIRRLQWDLAVEFTDRATSRYSLEREGLTAAVYARLGEIAVQAVAGFSAFGLADAGALETLLRAILDHLRVRQALTYPPFQDYLGATASPVLQGEARPTRETRAPVGFNHDKEQRTGAFQVYAWFNRANPGVHQTAIYNLVQRALPHLAPAAIVQAIDALVLLLERRGYLKQAEIGKKSVKFGKWTTHAWQVNQDLVEITAAGPRYRCPTCGVTRGYLLRAGGVGAPICATYRCRGAPALHQPDPEENFYVRVYTQAEPERLYPVEHSGQLDNAERAQIERKFKAGLVNTLVCTPTLELGVNIGDLAALILRNVPPTPSNYAQRAGRAGRNRRVALILAHAGLGPHDSYFFQQPQEMIGGRIRPPLFLLDNQTVIDRHLNSLILEKLATVVPSRWEEIRTEEGQLRPEVLMPFVQELAARRADIQAAVARAFVRERAAGGLPWLTDVYVAQRIDRFVDDLRAGLEHWCRRYQDIYAELRTSRAKVTPTAQEREREKRLLLALTTLQNHRAYYPLSYLGQVGFLPRYGFPGDAVAVRDEQQREITQSAAVGLTEYAPGNIVYVSGRKLRVERVVFRGGAKEDPQQNAAGYRYCTTCDYVSDRILDIQCPHCHGDLAVGRFVDYEAGSGREIDVITQDDEYRSREDYATHTYLKARDGAPAAQDGAWVYAGWRFAYSRRRQIELYNRGLRDQATGMAQPFVVCLECGAWHHPRGDEESSPVSSASPASGHLPSCTVTTWDAQADPRIAADLHLRAHLQGDVIEIPLPAEVVDDAAWIESFAQALKLGMQLEYFVGAHELDAFVRRWEEDGASHAALVIYDTMPGGAGYLQRLVENMPQLAARAVRHLQECPCERACYRCLKEFWNQRIHHLLDKRLVLPILAALAQAQPGASLPPVAAYHFDSVLEEACMAALRDAGLPLPESQAVLRAPDASYIMRADFYYPAQKLAILTDGRTYHTGSVAKVVEDLDRRNALALADCRLLEFTYAQVMGQPEAVVQMVRSALFTEAGADNIMVEDGGAAETLPAAAAVLVEQLCVGNSGWRRGGVLLLPAGNKCLFLAHHPVRRLALLLVDPAAWVRSATVWADEVARHNQVRLGGYAVIRVPRPWLDSPQIEALLARL